MHLRVYNYNTLERVNQFEAHSDYLRSIAIHPTHPYILSSSGKLVMDLTFLFVVSTIDWSQVQYEKGGGLLSGRASERKSEPK